MNPDSGFINHHHWQGWSRWLLIGLSVVMLVCAGYTLIVGIKLDTNLRSLSPSFSDDPVLNQALNRLSSNASQSVILVLAHEDQDQLDEASEFLQAEIESVIENKKNLLRYPEQSELLSLYGNMLNTHPFNFLGNEARAALSAQDQEEINRLALANLYGNASTIKLIDIEKDPFGFINEYAVAVMDNLTVNMQVESRQVRYQNTDLYIIPHVLQINTDSFSLATQKIVLQQIQQLLSRIQQEFPDIQFFQTGMIFFAADSAQSAQADINTISIGSALGIILLLLLVFRNIKAFFLPVISIALGVVTAFFICHGLFGFIHILTIVFGASLIGVVIDYALHYFYFCVHQNKLSENKMMVSRSAFYRALLLSLLSSVVGYAALAASGLKALMQIATFSAVGLIYAWLFVIVCGQHLTKGVQVYDARLNKVITSIIALLGYIAHARLLFFSLLSLVLMLWLGSLNMSVNDSPKALINHNPELIAQEQLVSGWISSYEPASFVLVSGNDAQEIFDRIAQLEMKLSGKKVFPESTRLLGVNQLFPSPVEQQTNYQLNQWIYQSSNSFAETFIKEQELDAVVNLRLLQNEYQHQAQQVISPQGLFNTLQALPPLWIEKKSTRGHDILSFMLIPKQTDIAALKKEIAGIKGITYFSAIDETQAGLKNLRESALQFLLVAIAMIAVILWYQYKLIKTLHLIAIPIISLCGSLLLLILFNVPLTLFHVMALFLVLGLGMDYVVFVAEMTSTEIESANNGDFFPAIVLSALTNLLSFGLLALSSMPAVNAFGITLFFGCCLNLFGAFWLAAIWRKSFLTPINS